MSEGVFGLIPSPNSMHERASFGFHEASITELPLFFALCKLLHGVTGEHYTEDTVFGIRTKELLRMELSDEVLHEQSLAISQYLWDIGYAVEIRHSRIPGEVVGKSTVVPVWVICWDPYVIRKKNTACPCWSCTMPWQEKSNCIGCQRYTGWAQYGI